MTSLLPTEKFCRIELLGPLRVTVADRTIERFPTQKSEGLLAYLALHPGPQSRERLIDLFWPEMDLPAGRNNLSSTLVPLRRSLEPVGVRRGSLLVTNHATVGLNPAAIATDVAAFEELLKAGARTEDPKQRADLLQTAVSLYRGDLLPGNYQDWAVREMERLQIRLQETLVQLAQDQETLGDLNSALQSVQRSLALDPYSEELHCQRVRLTLQTGHPGLAREIHQRFERLHQEEFGAAPSTQMSRRIAQLLALPPASTPARQAAPIPAASHATQEPRSGEARDHASPSPLPGPLPIRLSRFFGRTAELDQLVQLLLPWKQEAAPPCRLVTLIGPGGIGKTRIALEFARQASDRFHLWCGFVALSDLTEAMQVEHRITAALKISPVPEASPLDQAVAFLQRLDRPNAPPVLLLDNLEHLLSSAEDAGIPEISPLVEIIQTLLERVPGLRILCTSRRRLGLQGERILTLAPLPIPDAIQDGMASEDLALLLAVPSVRLYVDRAQSVRSDFGLTPTNAPAIIALCRHLEGSPLALELAAAWVRLLPPRKMWERLSQGQEIPSGTYTDLPARHRTLSAAIEWSFRLLAPAQRRLFSCLSVFRGGWTLEAAEAVCAEPDAMRLLSDLQEASLITAGEEAEDPIRFTFPETIRAFSERQRAALSDPDAPRRHHAAYFHAMATESLPHLRGPEQAEWLTRLEADHDNLRTALEWLLAQDAEDALKMAAALSWFWYTRGYWAEGQRWLESGLARSETDGTRTRASALNAAGGMAFQQGDFNRAQLRYQECLTILRTQDARHEMANVLHNLGFLAVKLGDLAQARRTYEESLLLQREFGDPLAIADALHHLGLVSQEQGNLERARELYAESLALRRPLGDQRGIALTMQNLANIAIVEGDYERAQRLHEETISIREEIGDRVGLADALHNLGDLARRQGDLERALALYREGLRLRRELGHLHGIHDSLVALAALAHARRQFREAARLYSVAETLLSSMSMTDALSDASEYQEAIRTLQQELSAAEFASSWQAGKALAWEEAVSEVLAEDPHTDGIGGRTYPFQKSSPKNLG